jgi:cephalosporin-C deacetylase-like acetyl esterase
MVKKITDYPTNSQENRRAVMKISLFLCPQRISIKELMKKTIVLTLMAIALLAAACAPSKHHGYVSKYPCHKIHPCCH